MGEYSSSIKNGPAPFEARLVSWSTSMIVVGRVGLNAIYQYDAAKSQMTSDTIHVANRNMECSPPGNGAIDI